MEKRKTARKKGVQRKPVQKKIARKKAAGKTPEEKRATKKTAAKKMTAIKRTAEKKTSRKKSVQNKKVLKKTVHKRPPGKRHAVSARAGTKKAKRQRNEAGRETGAVADIGKIPQGYNEDTIVIMPVNADTSFIYWEITEGLFKRAAKKARLRSAHLIIKVFEEDPWKEVYSFAVSDRIGKHYMKYHGSLTPLVAEIGIIQGGTFKGIVRSNPMTVSSSAGEATDDEIWMRRIKDAFEIVRISATGAIAEPGLQWLLVKYYREATAQRGSLFGSMFLSSP